MRLPAAERRRQLLEVATRVFAERGYHETSMNDIAEAAGVTKPVLYQHFDSKRLLYRDLLNEIGRRLQDEIGKSVAAATGPRDQIERGFATYFSFVARNGDAFQLLFNSGTQADPDFWAIAQETEIAIADAVADLIRISGITPERRRLLAHGVVGLAESTCRHWQATSPDDDPVVLARQVSELAWAGLRGIRT